MRLQQSSACVLQAQSSILVSSSLHSDEPVSACRPLITGLEIRAMDAPFCASRQPCAILRPGTDYVVLWSTSREGPLQSHQRGRQRSRYNLGMAVKWFRETEDQPLEMWLHQPRAAVSFATWIYSLFELGQLSAPQPFPSKQSCQ